MPRFKPTTKIDVIGNLDLDPENAVGDYIESKQQEAFFVKPPNWDSAGDSMELLLIHNEREHEAMLRLQEEMLENAKRQAATNASRIHQLYKLQANLRKRFIEVNSFIKDCEDKKNTADKKILEERQKHEELRKDIDRYTKSITALIEFRKELLGTVEEFEPYERVIADVVEKSDIFESVKDCMDRCDALMLAQVEIAKLEQQKIQEIEDMRKRMIKLTNEAALTVLGLQNDLAELEHSFTQSRNECLKWEKILANAKNCVAENDLNKERTLDGVHNMYRLLCKRQNKEPLFQRHEVEKQLDFIKEEVEILHEVVKECKQSNAKAETETERTKSKC